MYGQNLISSWKVTSFRNGVLLDTLGFITTKSNDTCEYYLPGVMFVCKFKKSILIVDFQEQSLSVLPLMSKVVDISGQVSSSNIETIVDDLINNESEKDYKIDSIYVIIENNKQTRYKFDSNGIINWIEVIEWTFNENNESDIPVFFETKTIYEKKFVNSKASEMQLTHYLIFKKGACRPTKQYVNWEFNNLIIE